MAEGIGPDKVVAERINRKTIRRCLLLKDGMGEFPVYIQQSSQPQPHNVSHFHAVWNPVTISLEGCLFFFFFSNELAWGREVQKFTGRESAVETPLCSKGFFLFFFSANWFLPTRHCSRVLTAFAFVGVACLHLSTRTRVTATVLCN